MQEPAYSGTQLHTERLRVSMRLRVSAHPPTHRGGETPEAPTPEKEKADLGWGSPPSIARLHVLP